MNYKKSDITHPISTTRQIHFPLKNFGLYDDSPYTPNITNNRLSKENLSFLFKKIQVKVNGLYYQSLQRRIWIQLLLVLTPELLGKIDKSLVYPSILTYLFFIIFLILLAKQINRLQTDYPEALQKHIPVILEEENYQLKTKGLRWTYPEELQWLTLNLDFKSQKKYRRAAGSECDINVDDDRLALAEEEHPAMIRFRYDSEFEEYGTQRYSEKDSNDRLKKVQLEGFFEKLYDGINKGKTASRYLIFQGMFLFISVIVTISIIFPSTKEGSHFEAWLSFILYLGIGIGGYAIFRKYQERNLVFHINKFIDKTQALYASMGLKWHCVDEKMIDLMLVYRYQDTDFVHDKYAVDMGSDCSRDYNAKSLISNVY